MKDEGILDDRTALHSDDLKSDARMRTSLPYLVVIDGPRYGRRFAIRSEGATIGRGGGADIQLDDQSVSRQHAKFSKEGDAWAVEDMGSKNGTFVNGSPISNKVIVGHKDVVKVGIYLVRLILKEVSQKEEMEIPQGMDVGEKTLIADMPLPHEVPTRTESEPNVPLSVEEKTAKKPILMYGVIAIVFIIGVSGLYAGWKYFLHPTKETSQTQQPAVQPELPVVKPVEPAAAPAPLPEPAPVPTSPEVAQPPSVEGAVPPMGAVPAAPPPEMAPVGQVQPPPVVPSPMPPSTQAMQPASPNARPVFLDLVSSPLPAKVSFDGRDLGTTPVRVNVEIEPRKYTVSADFYMLEIDEHYLDTKSIDVPADKQVIPILFKAPIGVLKFNGLPGDVQVHLKGSFEYQKFKEKAAKLENVVLQKPIYLPYGQYFVELRRLRRMSESSPTFVEDIILQRSFKIAEENPSYTLDVTEEGLKKFPVSLKTDPTGADVFIDGKKVGQTPYTGDFPLGKHSLALKKDGYFEHTESLDVDINTPFEVDVKLQTSLAGAHLNNANAAFKRGVYKAAIDELAQVLSSNPTPSEAAAANLLLGKSYLQLGDYQRALGYFEPLLSNVEQRHFAMLGMVGCYAYMNQKERAIPLLVEVLLKAKDENLKREANGLFQKISPLHSIIYVYTEPAGAKVFVNDKDVGQITPLILHELALGSYRLRLEKPGYESTPLNLNLSVNEFNPVIVTLKPVKE